MATTYKNAGVDPRRAEKVLKSIGASGSGGFGAVISLDAEDGPKSVTNFSNPYWSTGCKLVIGADGVGTKVEVARRLKKFDTIGIDLVAMCVNDILCHGAAPFAFLDYYATGKIHVRRSKEILAGIQKGCEIAGCNLVGGETAEMPGTYSKSSGKFDLAGFVVGITHIQNERPRTDQWRCVKEEDLIIGIPSSGLHSNGYSLVRACYDRLNLPYTEELLTPTRIYCQDVLPIMDKIKALAHITGGGIHGNLPRALPDDLTYDISLPHYPWIFQQMRGLAEMKMYDLESTFNCGWGMMLVIKPQDEEDVLKHIKDARTLGVVIPK